MSDKTYTLSALVSVQVTEKEITDLMEMMEMDGISRDDFLQEYSIHLFITAILAHEAEAVNPFLTENQQ